MAWGFDAVCPDCGHRWEGIATSVHIGPSSWDGPLFQDCRSLFCSQCYKRAHYPKAVERAAWWRWYKQFLVGLSDGSAGSVWLLPLLERVKASFVSKKWYVAQAIDLGEVFCPGCNREMVAGAEEGDRVICPRCVSNRPMLTEFTSHVNLAVGKDGFA